MIYYRDRRDWITQLAVYLAIGQQDKLKTVPDEEVREARAFLEEIDFQEAWTSNKA